MKNVFFLFVIVAGVSSCETKSVEPAVSSGPPYFPLVKGIINVNCMACHNSSGSWSGRPTAFDTDAQIVDAAETIKTAVAGPWTFYIKKMPQGGSLSQKDIDTIVAWVNAGGKSTD